MAKKYKGSLSLEWYNKQKSILVRGQEDIKMDSDIPAPKINWINKEDALFYEIDDEEGKGLTPYWVDRNDIRVKEARPLLLQKTFKAIQKDVDGTLQNTAKKWIVEERTEEDPSIDNILIKGDNLLALNTLKKMFDNKEEEEKVKCVFIDPPYNTGSAFEQYDDNLAHSEWLTLMRDRLVVLRSILQENGSVWISIDDDESHYLKMLCDEIFGRENFIANVVWQKKYSPQSDAKWFSDMHDHIIVYAKNKEIWRPNLLPRTEKQNKLYKHDDDDGKGRWRTDNMLVKSFSQSGVFPIKNPNTGEVYMPPKGRCWRINEDTYNRLMDENGIYFGKDGRGAPQLKRYLNTVKQGLTPQTIWVYAEVGHNQDAKKEVKEINPDDVFDTPKPEKLMQRIIHLGSNEGEIVLDCFGGSGTTFSVAHKMNRKWIGVELGDHADTHIIPRLKGVIEGTDEIGITEDVNWQGGGSFKYYYLGESIITLNQDGTGDFNWKLGRKYIEEAFLSSYDYIIDESLNLSNGYIFPDGHIPIIGVQEVGTKRRVAIISLNAPDDSNEFMTYDEIFHIYQQVKRHFNPQYINVFTNRGVEIAYESKPDDLEVIKVPKAIFSELEK